MEASLLAIRVPEDRWEPACWRYRFPRTTGGASLLPIRVPEGGWEPACWRYGFATGYIVKRMFASARSVLCASRYFSRVCAMKLTVTDW